MDIDHIGKKYFLENYYQRSYNDFQGKKWFRRDFLGAINNKFTKNLKTNGLGFLNSVMMEVQ